MNPEVRLCIGVQALLFSICVTLSKVLNLSASVSPMYNGNNNPTSLVVLFRSVPLKISVHTNHPGVCLMDFHSAGLGWGPGFFIPRIQCRSYWSLDHILSLKGLPLLWKS